MIENSGKELFAWYESSEYTWTDLYYDDNWSAIDAYHGFPPVNGSTGIPQTYLLDRDGTVRVARLGGSPPDAEYRAYFDELLGVDFE